MGLPLTIVSRQKATNVDDRFLRTFPICKSDPIAKTIDFETHNPARGSLGAITI